MCPGASCFGDFVPLAFLEERSECPQLKKNSTERMSQCHLWGFFLTVKSDKLIGHLLGNFYGGESCASRYVDTWCYMILKAINTTIWTKKSKLEGKLVRHFKFRINCFLVLFLVTIKNSTALLIFLYTKAPKKGQCGTHCVLHPAKHSVSSAPSSCKCTDFGASSYI